MFDPMSAAPDTHRHRIDTQRLLEEKENNSITEKLENKRLEGEEVLKGILRVKFFGGRMKKKGVGWFTIRFQTVDAL